MPASTSACSRRSSSRARASTPTSPSGRRAAATATCASTASSSRSIRGRGSTASRSTPSSCRSATWSSTAPTRAKLRALLDKALDVGKGVLHLLAPLTGLHGAMLAGTPTRKVGAVKVFSTRRACPTCGTSYPELDPRMFSYNSKHGWCTTCVGTGLKLTPRAAQGLRRLDAATTTTAAASRASRPRRPRSRASSTSRARIAPAPGSTRRRAPSPSRASRSPGSRSGRSATRASWVESLALAGREAEIARDVVTEIKSRLEFLEEVGLGYLTLDRAAPTLSGGEAQRIRLAAQLGSNLQGVCYVLDEPTIGLHPRDNAILLGALKNLSRQGQHAGRRRARRGDDPRAPTTSSTSAPARASAAAGWWPRAAPPRSRRIPTR